MIWLPRGVIKTITKGKKMPKLKSKSCVKKRCKLTKNGKVKTGHVNKRHLFIHKDKQRTRQARRTQVASTTVSKILKFFIHGKGV